MPQKSLLELVEKLPSSLAELESIKGIGKLKVQKFGKEILAMINDYCTSQGIERSPMEIVLKEEKIKIDTKKVSFDLYKKGKRIAEIEQLRSFTTGTIEGHLANYITTGEISVFDLVSKVKVAKTMAHIIQNPNQSTGETKAALGEDISYGELKAVMNHIRFVNAEMV